MEEEGLQQIGGPEKTQNPEARTAEEIRAEIDVLLDKYREAFERGGIVDQPSIHDLGPNDFRSQPFGESGTGYVIASDLRRRGLIEVPFAGSLMISQDTLWQIRELLGQPLMDRGRLQIILSALEEHEAVDEDTFSQMDMDLLRRALIKFGNIGYTPQLYHATTGKFLGRRHFTGERRKEIADAVEFTVFGKVRRALFEKGYVDRGSLMTVDMKEFCQEQFEGFGSGYMLIKSMAEANLITVNKDEKSGMLIINRNIFAQIVDRFDLPKLNKRRRIEFFAALEEHGTTSRIALRKLSRQFEEGSIELGGFESGKDFYWKLTGRRSPEGYIAYQHMDEMADIMGFDLVEDAKKAFREKGIRSQSEVLAMKVKEFSRMDFGKYGTGYEIVKSLADEGLLQVERRDGSKVRVKKPVLKQLCKLLELPLISKKEHAKISHALETKRVVDRESLKALKIDELRRGGIKFGELGTIRAIYKAIFGESIKGRLQPSHLDQIADVIFDGKIPEGALES